MSLELNGDVFLVERSPGKRAKRSSIDGELVLRCLLASIIRGMDLMEPRQKASDPV